MRSKRASSMPSNPVSRSSADGVGSAATSAPASEKT
jgi:hypothetical protein